MSNFAAVILASAFIVFGLGLLIFAHEKRQLRKEIAARNELFKFMKELKGQK